MSFFMRTPSVSLPSGGRIRNGAFCTVSGGSFSLGSGAGDTHENTYHPGGGTRPAPVLNSVSVTLEGEAGSLRKCEVNFTCFTKGQLDSADASILTPKSNVTISYGYAGPGGGSGGSHTFTVYDYSFSLTKENYYTCTLKGVGKGMAFEKLKIDGSQNFPGGITFTTDYDGFNDNSKVQNMFDFIDYTVQEATGRNNSTSFDPPDGAAGEAAGGWYGVLKAPKDYDPPSKLDTGWFTTARIIHVSLGMIVSIVNNNCLNKNPNGYKIKFDPKWSKLSCQYPSGKIFSPNPIECMFPYASGVPEHRYGKDGWFKEALNIDRYDALPGSVADSPENIMIGRDLLRALQKAFDDTAKEEKGDDDPKQKATGGIELNKFFTKLFATIRDNSGGAWDLMLNQNEGDDSNIWIVNKKGMPDPVVPLMLDVIGGVDSPPDNGIRELSLAAKVPKEVQAKVFAGDTNESSQAVEVMVGGSDDDGDDDGPTSLSEKSTEARKKLHDDKYSQDAISSARGIVREIVDEPATAQKAALGLLGGGNSFESTPFPVEFSATMDGVEGWKFGDTISSNMLPARYKKTAGLRVVFTLTKYEHKIEANDWTTTVEGLSRFINA